ncbi:zinc ribbon domain-containing protein [Streptomyces sp. NPDC058066]|uniref:zinc ribbon domain-containing protein n=1 Tax=Streptomyces sp. NPDC058066 TaxID=3346323 RepID=UPI0036E03B39
MSSPLAPSRRRGDRRVGACCLMRQQEVWGRENQAVAVEGLAASGLARSRLAKSVHDAAWSRSVAMLDYKAQRYGRPFVSVGRFEPTSQVCCACGHRDGARAP